MSFFLAPALHIAKETPRIALAPSLDLFGVPSNCNMRLSISVCCVTSRFDCGIENYGSICFPVSAIRVACYVIYAHDRSDWKAIPSTTQEQWWNWYSPRLWRRICHDISICRYLSIPKPRELQWMLPMAQQHGKGPVHWRCRPEKDNIVREIVYSYFSEMIT